MRSRYYPTLKNDMIIFSNVPLLLIIVIALYIIVVMIRITSPSNLDDYNQGKQIIFITDIVSGQNPFIHHGNQGELYVKPPLYHFITAIPFFLNKGYYSEFILKLPNLISGLFVLIILFYLSKSWFGISTAFISCVILILSGPFSTAIYVARSDVLFTLLILLSLLIINYTFPINRDANGKLWWVFWVIVALSVLTRGFWGFILPVLYYLFFLYSENRLKDISIYKPLIGFISIICLLIMWFLLVFQSSRFYISLGSLPLSFKTVLLNFFFGLFVPEIEWNKPQPFYTITVLYFARLFPWSIISILAIFYAWVKNIFYPIENTTRSSHRVTLWFLLTLLFFAFIPGKRYVMFLLPVYTASAILSGWLINELFILKLMVNRVYKYRSIFEGIWLILLWILIILGLVIAFSIKSLSPEWYKTIDYLRIIVEEWTDARWVMITIGGLFLSGLSSLILIIGWARHYRIAITLSIFQGILILFLFYHFFSGSALTRDGESLKEFKSSISRFTLPLLDKDKGIRYFNVGNGLKPFPTIEFYEIKNLPIPFLLQLNKRELTDEKLRELSKSSKKNIILVIPSKEQKTVEMMIGKKLKILYEGNYIYNLKSPIILASTEEG